jgi:hypothetical protein
LTNAQRLSDFQKTRLATATKSTNLLCQETASNTGSMWCGFAPATCDSPAACIARLNRAPFKMGGYLE